MTPYDFTQALREGDALIIMPPFAHLAKPSLSAHLLQACAREAGIRVSVLYANYLWAAIMGEECYSTFTLGEARSQAVGERMFAAAAYGGPLLGRDAMAFRGRLESSGAAEAWPELTRLASLACEWAEEVAAGVARCGFKAVGCTTTFEQTSASVALLDRIKARQPACVTMIGGANCEGEMAEGILSLGAATDFIFAGESDDTFVRFMQDLLAGKLPERRIIPGTPCLTLDDLPAPRYEEFFEQRALFLPNGRIADSQTWLLVEGSRGCWWGEKQHCTFCGCNASGMRFREKSPDRVIGELAALRATYPTRRVVMTDRVMPRSYFHTLIPRLKTELPGLEICYEQKANLSLENVLALKEAGVTMIQPGIESLSSALLRRMRKGVSAAQNLALLRYARSAALLVHWNLLYAFPGDEPKDYEEMMALLPLVHHLYPPMGSSAIGLQRFSPYVDEPALYGVRNLRPAEAYTTVFPAHANASKLAYFFEGDYETAAGSSSELGAELMRRVAAWREAWGCDWKGGPDGPPRLTVERLSDEALLLHDTRGLEGTLTQRLLTRAEASAALVGGRYEPTPVLEWAIAHRIGVVCEGAYVPLATADPALLLQFEAERRNTTLPAV
jgi:ribosomal peptide maturation radical SAM protein 1